MSETSGLSTDHAAVTVPPPLIYVAFFVVGVGLQLYLPLGRLPIGIGRVVGAGLVLSGLVLSAWSVRRFWAAGTSVLPVRPTTALVIEGPYRWTRNPMYLALLLMYIGAALWFALVWPLLLAPVLVVVMNVSVICREERYLTRKFGGEYRHYQTQVRRWL